jgi:hypothetical protein
VFVDEVVPLSASFECALKPSDSREVNLEWVGLECEKTHEATLDGMHFSMSIMLQQKSFKKSQKLLSTTNLLFHVVMWVLFSDHFLLYVTLCLGPMELWCSDIQNCA